MKATRDAFGDQILESSVKNSKIVVLSADLSKATRTDKFAKRFPDRFVEVGIAECNMIGIASGMSEHGFRPFLSSFASFLTGKYDVIRVSAAYSESPIVLVGTHSGMAIGKDGVTQMGLEDVSLMRSLPGMTVMQPATYIECREAVKYLCETDTLSGPVYLRLGRQPVKEVFNESYVFDPVGISTVSEGSDIVILSTGCILPDVLASKTILLKEGINPKIVNIHTIKPLPEKHILECVKNASVVITVEDHSIIGGLGSAISELLSEISPKRVLRIGLSDIFPESAPPEDLYRKYGLDAPSIAKRILDYVDK